MSNNSKEVEISAAATWFTRLASVVLLALAGIALTGNWGRFTEWLQSVEWTAPSVASNIPVLSSLAQVPVVGILFSPLALSAYGVAFLVTAVFRPKIALQIVKTVAAIPLLIVGGVLKIVVAIGHGILDLGTAAQAWCGAMSTNSFFRENWLSNWVMTIHPRSAAWVQEFAADECRGCFLDATSLASKKTSDSDREYSPFGVGARQSWLPIVGVACTVLTTGVLLYNNFWRNDDAHSKATAAVTVEEALVAEEEVGAVHDVSSAVLARFVSQAAEPASPSDDRVATRVAAQPKDIISPQASAAKVKTEEVGAQFDVSAGAFARFLEENLGTAGADTTTRENGSTSASVPTSDGALANAA